MSWRDKLVIRILMLVAKIVAEADLQQDIRDLAAHIAVNAPTPEYQLEAKR